MPSNSEGESIQEQCIDYLFDLMSAEERAMFEPNLSKPEYIEAMREAGAMFVAVAKSAPARPLSPVVKGGIFNAINAALDAAPQSAAAPNAPLPLGQSPVRAFADRPALASERRRMSTATVFALFGVLILAVLSTAFYLNLRDKDNTIAELSERTEKLEVKLDQQFIAVSGLRRALEQQSALTSFFQTSTFKAVDLKASDPSPRQGKVFWSEQKKRLVLYLTELPVNAKGKEYELWTIQDGKPQGAGLFSVKLEAEEKEVFIELPAGFGSGVQTFAITEEPIGGSPAPTGTILLAGNL
ncbi:MAG: anti-sigma factor [Rhizobacter sp.]|nr:anti-sigma factor [Chlorobiales bacterium]